MKINAITPNTINRRYDTTSFKANVADEQGYYKPNQDGTQFNQNLKQALDIANDPVGGAVYKLFNKLSKVFKSRKLDNSQPIEMTNKEFSDYLAQRAYLI